MICFGIQRALKHRARDVCYRPVDLLRELGIARQSLRIE